jgi:1-pyrroline-5-carboxylate dehydrogenase
MHDGSVTVPHPGNEPVLGYAPGSPERARLTKSLEQLAGECPEIPAVIGGQRVTTGRLVDVVMPHAHRHVVARFHACDGGHVDRRRSAAATDARREWETMRWEARAAVFLRAAELLAGPWRMRINAATMLGQSKTCHQAEIDARAS